ncbi:hypothetical protein ACFL6I_23390 [candidate division KSB1 bacterium]
MSNIGFSTGCLYKLQKNIDEIVWFYEHIGATAVELCFATSSELADFEITSGLLESVKKIPHVTLHAPWKEIRYNNSYASKKVLERLKHISEKFKEKKIKLKGIVVHPDIIDDLDSLSYTNLPFLIENMDKRKDFGTLPEHFEKLKQRCKLGFVLDVQHAYENDPKMYMAGELIDVMGDRLKELHVSGFFGKQNHYPVHASENEKEISQILRLNIHAPKILEGIIEYEQLSPSQVARNELEFVKNYHKMHVR